MNQFVFVLFLELWVSFEKKNKICFCFVLFWFMGFMVNTLNSLSSWSVNLLTVTGQALGPLTECMYVCQLLTTALTGSVESRDYV